MASPKGKHLWGVEVVAEAEQGGFTGVTVLSIAAGNSDEALSEAKKVYSLQDGELWGAITYKGEVHNA